MSKKKEFDHSMTNNGIEEMANAPSEGMNPEVDKESKLRSGVFGIVAIVSSLVLLVISFINPFHTNGQFHLDADTDITIKLKLSSAEFLVISNKNVCDGVGAVSGIKSSTAYASAPSLSAKTAIGTGQLNDQGECEYVIKIATSDNFNGGKVNFSFKFPFGKSREFPIDIGDKAPYKVALISIPLD